MIVFHESRILASGIGVAPRIIKVYSSLTDEILSGTLFLREISESTQAGEAGDTGGMPLPKPKVLSRGI